MFFIKRVFLTIFNFIFTFIEEISIFIEYCNGELVSTIIILWVINIPRNESKTKFLPSIRYPIASRNFPKITNFAFPFIWNIPSQNFPFVNFSLTSFCLHRTWPENSKTLLIFVLCSFLFSRSKKKNPRSHNPFRQRRRPGRRVFWVNFPLHFLGPFFFAPPKA